jgi:hypothetical protein
MAVRKNPDWSVWLADVWYSASRPPGIYICIIAILGAALWYSLSAPTTRIARTTPQSAAPATRIPQASQSQPMPPPGYCNEGNKYDGRIAKCVIWLPGVQDDCPVDYDFENYLNGCVSLFAYPRWRIDPGSRFEISGFPPTRINILEGAISVHTLGNPKYPYAIFYGAGQSPLFTGNWIIVAADRGATITLTHE